MIDQRLFVQHANDGILAEDARHDRHAEVDLAAAIDCLETAVLRDPALGDVQFGKHLHARDGLLRVFDVRDALHEPESSIDTELDDKPGSESLEVNVARADLKCVVQGRANEPYDLARVLADRAQRKVARPADKYVFPRLEHLRPCRALRVSARSG